MSVFDLLLADPLGVSGLFSFFFSTYPLDEQVLILEKQYPLELPSLTCPLDVQVLVLQKQHHLWLPFLTNPLDVQAPVLQKQHHHHHYYYLLLFFLEYSLG